MTDEQARKGRATQRLGTVSANIAFLHDELVRQTEWTPRHIASLNDLLWTTRSILNDLARDDVPEPNCQARKPNPLG